MNRKERLSVARHVLLHMSERQGRAMTSEEMADCVSTNAVVIRRTFAGLREAGIVTSVKGHAGGWRGRRAKSASPKSSARWASGGSVAPDEPPPRCAMDEGPQGRHLRVDDGKQTSVPGVYAAGDAASPMHNATLASAAGVLAGVGAHQSLVAHNIRPAEAGAA